MKKSLPAPKGKGLPDVPKAQRLAARPQLEEIFKAGQPRRV